MKKISLISLLFILYAIGYSSQLAAVQEVMDQMSLPLGSARVSVKDSVTGEPVQSARVTIANDLRFTATALTELSGEAKLDANPGTYNLTVTRPDYFRSTPVSVYLNEGTNIWAVGLEPRPSSAFVSHFILVISDGVSWEVLNQLSPTNIMAMVSQGAAASHGVSEMPSATKTNKRTILTGTHASTHGRVGNRYLIRRAERVDFIQKAVQRAGFTYEEVFSASEILSRIQSETLPNFTLWWSSDTDNAAHGNGPDSPEYASAIFSMDTWIGQIMDALETTGLVGQTVLGFGSDHGMEALLSVGQAAPVISRILDLRSILQDSGFGVFSWRASGPRMGHIYLDDPSQAPAAKAALKATPGIHNAFIKAELDGVNLGGDMIGYLNHPNSGDVIAFALPEYAMGRSIIQSSADGLGNNDGIYFWDVDNLSLGGHGGLTTREMYVPFVLWGNAIRVGVDLGPRYNVDWAPTIAAFLNIAAPIDSEGRAAIDALESVSDP